MPTLRYLAQGHNSNAYRVQAGSLNVLVLGRGLWQTEEGLGLPDLSTDSLVSPTTDAPCL
jgi:hypothetical protein